MFARPCLRTKVLVTAVAAVGAALTCTAPVAFASATSSQTVLPEQSTGWSYNETESSDTAFFAPDYDDSGWSVGQAGFGDEGGTCSFDVPGSANTFWNTTYIDLRHHFTVPSGTTSISITGTVDNDATVAVNGETVDTASSGNCDQGGISATVPASALTSDNVIAVLGENEGGPQYVDLSITATVSARPTVTGVDPASGPLGGGNTVVLTGSGFTNAKRVVFGTVQATNVTVDSDSQITVTAPAGTKAGVVNVRVSDGQGIGASAKAPANRYRYLKS
jgi:hypothetical protein